ncbi:MAG: hypothetical protein F9K23_18485 [Bacteroidetes bacterium]|nr:MAG: hypothetical protein F9K23_18485 [Bacteroidota bacterium]
MKRITLLLFCLLAGYTVSRAQKSFPAGYAGIWKGDLYMYTAGVKNVGKIPMSLTIKATDSTNQWIWIISYLPPGKTPDQRNYELIVTDSARGKYTIDEKNGILIDARMVGNVLATRFAVGESLLLITYKLEGDSIVFEVTSGPVNTPHETGNQPENDVPPVIVYAITGYQKAVLVKDK